jgi:hypothetical protein
LAWMSSPVTLAVARLLQSVNRSEPPVQDSDSLRKWPVVRH